MIERNRNWVLMAKELKDTQSKLKFLKEKKKEVESKLRELSENVSSSGDGYKYKIYSRPGVVDYKSIPELEEVDLDKYRKEDQKYWKLSFTEQFAI